MSAFGQDTKPLGISEHSPNILKALLGGLVAPMDYLLFSRPGVGQWTLDVVVTLRSTDRVGALIHWDCTSTLGFGVGLNGHGIDTQPGLISVWVSVWAGELSGFWFSGYCVPARVPQYPGNRVCINAFLLPDLSGTHRGGNTWMPHSFPFPLGAFLSIREPSIRLNHKKKKTIGGNIYQFINECIEWV
jgi:hypothetical protein